MALRYHRRKRAPKPFEEGKVEMADTDKGRLELDNSSERQELEGSEVYELDENYAPPLLKGEIAARIEDCESVTWTIVFL